MVIGKQIGHYQVLEILGRGGMGEVFLAQDTILNRRVALKFLTSAVPGQESRRLLAEARAAASLEHPDVCRIFATGEYEGKPFLVMEYVDGETLEHRLASGPMPLQQALEIMISICGALAEAHAKALLHRDLKPANIMITRAERLKLMDFGVAMSIHTDLIGSDDPTRTLDLPKAGTTSYMAPEQSRGEKLDARADVFALGIVFYEMLSGHHPFRKATMVATAAAILYEAAPPIEKYVPESALSLGEVLNHALAKDPAERYASASELLAALIALRTAPEAGRLQAPRPLIAVLPFRDLSPARDQEYFCDGLAEEMIVALSRMQPLRVVSQSAAFRYRDTGVPLGEIGKALKATTILEGSVRKVGERMRIVVNLVEAESGASLWSERYDRQLDDIFDVQDEIASQAAEKLRTVFGLQGAEKQADFSVRNPRAWELYLKGRHFWNKRTEQNLRVSIEQFEQAIAEDPQFAPGWTGIADAWIALSLVGAERPLDAMPRARQAVDSALEIRAELPDALLSRGSIRAIFDWDWRAAEEDFDKAIRFNPQSAQARQWFAMNCLAPRGLFERAGDELKRAGELEPLSFPIATSIGVLDFFRGRYDSAVQHFRSVLELDPGYYLAHYFLGQVLVEKQLCGEAVSELECAAELADGSPESLAMLGYAQAAAGHSQDAVRILQGLQQRERERYVSPVLLAQVQAGLEQTEAALGNLERALDMRSTDLIWLKVRPALSRLLSMERAQKLLLATGLRGHSR